MEDEEEDSDSLALQNIDDDEEGIATDASGPDDTEERIGMLSMQNYGGYADDLGNDFDDTMSEGPAEIELEDEF